MKLFWWFGWVCGVQEARDEAPKQSLWIANPKWQWPGRDRGKSKTVSYDRIVISQGNFLLDLHSLLVFLVKLVGSHLVGGH